VLLVHAPTNGNKNRQEKKRKEKKRREEKPANTRAVLPNGR
jgi:hypothetical protein